MKFGLTRPALVLFICLGVAACVKSGTDREADTDGAPAGAARVPPGGNAADPDPEGAALARIGIVFDPSRVRRGDSIAGLVVERIAVARAIDSSFVGGITFKGELQMAGRTFPHPEADATDAACFDADSASAVRMPRWAGDRRRAWFCFVGLGDSVVGASRNPAQMLERAAREIVAFLKGEVGFEKISLADTVVLYLSPEGGGTRASFARENLRTPSRWVIRSMRQSYSFVPPRTLTKMTAKAGRHFNCGEYALASRFSDLATLPHVGVKLEPETSSSCLQSWNATFVFDTIERSPRLVAAVYDQWEW